MKYLLKKCMILDENSPFDGKKMDILIKKNTILQIAKNIEDDSAEVIKGKKLYISTGWMDIGTSLGEPGHEQRETMASLCAAARAGGYTDLAVFPNAIPATQTQAQVTQLIDTGKKHGVSIHPIGALSKDRKGEEITEIIDLQRAGAVAFSDGNRPVEKDGLLLRALQYVKSFDGLILHHPRNESLDNGGHVHEGDVSVAMGLKGSPTLSETLTLERDLQLAAYTESRLAIHNISSKESISRLKNLKKENDVYASVACMNLVETDAVVETFDVNFKVDPPLRSKSDKNALIKAVNTGDIDYITSNHTPLEEELKKLEFPYAEPGIINLQTCFSVLNSAVGDKIDIRTLVHKISKGPKQMLGIQDSIIDEGQKGSFTIFDTEEEWTFTSENNVSISSNSPYLGKTLKGKVLLTVV